jgi:dienelactone hydrolase
MRIAAAMIACALASGAQILTPRHLGNATKAANPGQQASPASDSVPLVSPAGVPGGAEGLPAAWITVSLRGVGTMIAAVATPRGTPPFPAVLLLHGSHGFAREYVMLAHELSDAGFIAVAACWFSGGNGEGARFITPLACPDAPRPGLASSPEARRAIDALVHAARHLPDSRSNHLGLLGHSRGGGAALNYLLTDGKAEALVLDSAGYPSEALNLVPRVTAPILLFHGDQDSPDDGGSPMTNVRMARAFEGALRSAAKDVEAVYYSEGTHNGLFASPKQHQDQVRRMVAFLKRTLVN